MNIASTMEQALQAGTAKASRISVDSVGTSGWRVEFWRPLDAALHIGTPPKSKEPFMPIANVGPQVIE